MAEEKDLDYRIKAPDDHSPDAWAKMMQWQSIWLRTIAKAWSDPGFKTLLLKSPREAIGKEFGYNIPWTLELTISEVPAEDQNPNQRGFHDWDELPAMKLEMYLPPAPNLEVQAVALADYAESGRTYPFTCC